MFSFINEFLSLSSISGNELILRVFLAMLFGLIIGLDRDSKNKPIDYRAYMIVAITTCAIAILGQELNHAYANATDGEFVSLDLGKIISGALTGIGFLGAGAIIQRDDKSVIGSATGASIWASGGIGLALGFGFYRLAFVAFFAIGLILIGGGFCMKYLQDKSDKI